jgi:broad specificity phosphatase PhoE
MREKEIATSILFVRHGQTDFPLDRIYCDDAEDPALNQNGVAQANRAAAYLAPIPLAAIYASPCQRTLATANAVAAALERPNVRVDVRPTLMERRFGIWEGLFFHEIESQYPEEYRRWKSDNSGYKPQGGESIFDMLARIKPTLEEIIAKHKGETVAVVGHVGPIRAMIADALCLPLTEYRRIAIDYASISQINYGRKQNNLIFCNMADRRLG